MYESSLHTGCSSDVPLNARARSYIITRIPSMTLISLAYLVLASIVT